MWKRLITGLGMAASLALAAGCASSVMTSSAVSRSANPGGLPQLKLRPASGPAGTYVTIRGQLNPGQVRANESYFRYPAYFNLITDVRAGCAKAPHAAYLYDCSAGPASLAGCELIVGLIHPLINLDTATGRVSGSFTVGGTGTCFQDRPTDHPQATLPGRYVLAIGAHATSWALFEVTGSPVPAPAGTAPAEVHVASCPIPARDYAGTPYSPRPAPGMLSLPSSLTLPGDAQIFGTEFLPGPASYLLGPRSATCQGELASADGGETMMATSVSDRSASATMIVSPGGAGPSTDLACPYIPAVLAADKIFRQNVVFCNHPPADVIRQIPTYTASLYAAAVLVPARVKDSNIQGSGDGPGPAVALYTAQVGQGAAEGQMVACTLAPGQAGICAASLKFFLATQAQISTRISAANLNRMQHALSSFLAGQNI
ncbi:MAG TPA: hypothetical protein VGS62_01655 [Streptosporangiaceae bacterium]|nr:hypothetical protein [Streptosporangiaceae bacterium]